MKKASKKKRPAIFLDRDGTINEPPLHRYIRSWDQFRFIPGVLGALRQLAKKEALVIIVSNQSGVGRGLMPKKQLDQVTRNMLREIRKAGGRVHQVYYCTHPPEIGCACRKPQPGLLKRAARKFSIDLSRSTVVGDTETDMLMARAAGCRKVLVLTGRRTRKTSKQMALTPDRVTKDLAQATRWILHQSERDRS